MKTADRLGGVKTLKVSGFLDEFEKDDVKRKVDIVELFESFGVRLSKQGKNYMGLCPFHDDKNPSLSVDREKGLYNCFGCGEGGDGFDLVMKLKGIGFREALDYLKGSASGKAIPSFKYNPADNPQGERGGAKSVEQALPKQPAVATPSVTLDEVNRSYTKSLAESKEAVTYLESRGLWFPEILKRLEVGYCTGELRSKVPDSGFELLKDVGIFTEKDTEAFKSCITIPLFGEDGKVCGFYGRRINNRKPAHLYLKGPHRGLVNRKAAAVYPERIIITESVIDALSLLAIGVENVIPVYGVNGFTDEHMKLLKDKRVKEICIAFDSDDAGRKGSQKLKSILLSEGFGVREIFPANSKDWNEALLSGFSLEEFNALASNSLLETPEAAEPSTGFEARKEGVKHFFKASGINYRVLGVKEMFVSSLRVNIKAETEDAGYLDNVDLYSARSRGLFAGSLAESVKIDSGVIERDLLLMVEYLEGERDKKLQPEDSGPVELSDQERKLGMEFLCSPDLFNRIEEDTEALGYVGEGVNKRLIYLAASSRKLSDPISVIVISQSAAGKSYLIDTVKKLIPPEDVVSMTSLSDQALNYLPEDGLMHKFLVMGEAVHSEPVEHQIREMLSAHELSRLVTLKDPKSGSMQSRVVRKEVIVSAVMSSTNHNINPENASRSFVINTDESEAQTVAIHRAQRQKYSVERYEQRENVIPEIIKAHHAAQRLLEKRVIVNPFAELLDFPAALMRSRRDHERFMDLIASVCFLRQFQKEEKVTENGVSYIECDLVDYETAFEIMTAILPATLTNFPKGALELYEEVRSIIKDKAKDTDMPPLQVSITQREIRELTGLSQMFVKRNMRILSDYEYIYASGGSGGRVRKSYRLVADERIKLIDISVIPEPSKMKTLLRTGSLGSDWVTPGADPENKG